ncbi:BnaC03g27510D [Brassica napus]|uniref:BnaC03g27510D protein n=2 Tax=Brassica napus TaxID=3708 RepID=A0A078G7Q9_BRANA|nr:BnaC03g27510D [Brassica napus]
MTQIITPSAQFSFLDFATFIFIHDRIKKEGNGKPSAAEERGQPTSCTRE